MGETPVELMQAVSPSFRPSGLLMKPVEKEALEQLLREFILTGKEEKEEDSSFLFQLVRKLLDSLGLYKQMEISLVINDQNVLLFVSLASDFFGHSVFKSGFPRLIGIVIPVDGNYSVAGFGNG